MKAFLGGVAISLGLLAVPAWAADNATADEAVTMVKKAAAAIRSDGRDKAFAAIADPANKDYHDRDLYIFVYDMQGNCLAHGNNARMVGKNLIELKDVDGKGIVKEFVALAKSPAGNGWVDYKWPNPVSKSVEKKSAFVMKVDDILVGSGVYK